MEDIQSSSAAAFRELELLSREEGIPPTSWIQAVTDFNMKTGEMTFRAGFLYEGSPDLPAGLDVIDVPDHRALHVSHTGAFRHLGNAWSTGNELLRKGLVDGKIDREQPPYEINVIGWEAIDEAELQSELYFPVR